MAKYGIVIDVSRCTACYCCFAACKDEHWENDYPPYSAAQPRFGQFWIDLVKKERGIYPCIKVAYLPIMCVHCNDAPCIKAARNGAVYKRPDGIVVINPEKAIGQKQIADACPYKAIFWNIEKNIPQKCTLCVHRIEEGKVPRCVLSCPSEALKFGDLNDPDSEVSKIIASGKTESLHPEFNTNPIVRYIAIPKIFIAGSVVFEDTNDCAEGALVNLLSNGKSNQVTANAFGDFMFDGLDAGKYSVKIDSKGYKTRVLDVDLKTDNYLGAIRISKA